MFVFRLPFLERFDAAQLLCDLTFTDSSLWFVDFILRWYVVYWVARRFFSRHTTVVMALYSLWCMQMPSLMSGQALSFFCGYLASEHYDRIRAMRRSSMVLATAAVMAWGIAFYLLKTLPPVQALKGTLPFNLVLLNVLLPLSMGLFLVPWLLPSVSRIAPINWAGKACYEIYIVHWNFMPFVGNSIVNVGLFSALSLTISAIFYRFNQCLKLRGELIPSLSLLLFCGVGYLLMLKYSMRVTEWYGAVSLGYVLLVAVAVVGMRHRLCASSSCYGRWRLMALVSLAVLVVAQLAVQCHIDPMGLSVDRWSAIHNCLTALFDGRFPYDASTHLGGKASPFPVWMALHIPFWLLGNVGLSETVTTCLFLFSVRLLYGWRGMAMATVLMALSVNVWYEVAVRSDLISNFLLLAAFINVLHAKGWTFWRYPYLLSACAGLWLSTRLSTAFPLCVVFLPGWVSLPLRHKAGTALTAALVFCLTFLPLALWDADSLFHAEFNPFVLQTRQGMSGDVPAMLALCCLLSLAHRARTDRMLFCCALTSLSVPAINFLHRMCVRGDWADIFTSYYDITYFDAAVPFLIACVCRRL